MLKDADEYVQGVLAGNRLTLSRTITLIESALPSHQEMAAQVLSKLQAHCGRALRLGVTGVPGAGKSTFIESFGSLITEKGLQVAVLAIDPMSTLSGGAVLGDKTRMINLSTNDRAFIRPTSSGGTLGGVSRKTRETMLVCEAAGFDVIIVETVGVGQSETAVASMVDFFLVMMIAGGGDELQCIKKGILELADAVVVNKADGDNVGRVVRACQEFQTALHLLTHCNPLWSPPVLPCSAREGTGLEDLWDTIGKHREIMTKSGDRERKRIRGAVDWLHQLLDDGLRNWFYQQPGVNDKVLELEASIRQRGISAVEAAATLLARLGPLDTPQDG
ncbi:MAG: methylmalonyl Co-A mutase-associated GTPase MeaB [Myxococcota bacterium]|jgi:LAO/AO transport system kinase|nr:methylmalonyl Co-A mutase-associated GTPase MeaB [Myxococcota bacterium]